MKLKFVLQKSIPTIDPTIWNALLKRLLSVSIRSHVKNNNSRFWTVEIIFYETPLKSKHHREQGKYHLEKLQIRNFFPN